VTSSLSCGSSSRKTRGSEHVLSGSLVVVGTGIQFGNQTTQEARREIERADKVLYLFADPAPVPWITRLNPTAESLTRLYAEGKPRNETYAQIVQEILSWVRRGLRVCTVFYGHPGVFVTPSHEAVRRARSEGFDARMLPGVSAEDCLFADLGLDPGDVGCQSFEATTFLLYHGEFDTSIPLILWQIAAIGERAGATKLNRGGLEILLDRLAERYGPDHDVVLYEASPYVICEPTIQHVPVMELDPARVTGMATLYVPPKREPDPDLEMFDRLGIAPPSMQ
jgi:uncharacterized protein YabN with tetrapyrrole methylase and pyrophosphatase domain